MLQNYFKMAWRVILKQRLHSFLNVIGLAIGLATALLLLLWIKDELGYDRFHPQHPHIVKVMLNITSDAQDTQTYGWVAPPVADAMQREIPGVVQTTCSWEQKTIFSHQAITDEETGLVADSTFLQVFHFPLVKGEPTAKLLAPHSILITQRLAEKYFGKAEPLGKIIRLDRTNDMVVAGVLADIPGNSSLQFDYLRPLPTPASAGSWLEVKANVFAVLNPNANFEKLRGQLKAMTQRHLPEWLTGWVYFPYRLDDLYLRSNFKNGQYAGGGQITYVRLFGIVAVFVLLIATINFMNLSTAQATRRAKEVGIRKAVGAAQGSLIGQFLSESFLLTGVAGLLALGIVLAILPLFNDLLQKQISIDWLNPLYGATYGGVLLMTAVLAGLYPAFVLSSFKPVKVLKGLRYAGSGGVIWLRKSLVVVQFTATAMLLAGTGLVYQQIDFIRTRNLGFQQQNLIRFPSEDLKLPQPYQHAKAVLSSTPGVESVSSSSSSFQGTYGRNYVEWAGQRTMFAVITGDHDLLTTLGISLQSGRNFSPQFGTDSSGVILNEAAARRMQFQRPLDQVIRVNNEEYKVIGVVKDFHIASIHQQIEPMVILYDTKNVNYFFVRMNAQNRATALRNLETAYQSLRPQAPFNFQFVDQEYERIYQNELQIGTLANWFSGIAIFISCLGLFGLASFSVERRTKEIGIRKVLGASVTGVFMLLNKEFIRLVLLAQVLAIYPVWVVMNGWLNKFAYHAEIGVGIFVAVGVLSLGIALFTVSLHSFRAALMNPVKSLQTD